MEGLMKIEPTIESIARGLNDLALAMKQGFDAVDARFGSIDKKFDGIDSRLDTIDDRLDTIDSRLGMHDDHFDSLENRVNLLTHEIALNGDAIARLTNLFEAEMAAVLSHLYRLDERVGIA